MSTTRPGQGRGTGLSEVREPKEDKSEAGGLSPTGREKYNRETSSNLKAPQPEGGKRDSGEGSDV